MNVACPNPLRRKTANVSNILGMIAEIMGTEMTRSLIIGIAFVAAAVNAALAKVLTAPFVPAAHAVEAVSEAVAVLWEARLRRMRTHPYRALDNRDSAASMWMLTLALFVWFLICSLVAALLATHFGWLGPANGIA
jgi:sterol desaturase/sphingolipid hydroxylase (fatty acid hydroxylase superfamily)